VSLTPPFLLLDRYDVSAQIGRGGHAVVYRAHDRVFDRPVAIKLLRDDAVSPDVLARFRQEIQLTARLEHAHILHVYDTGTFEGLPFVVMELASGQTLADRLAREGPLPVADALQITRDVGLALAHAHARGIVHRDVKPENILLGSGGAMLADFGVARVTADQAVQRLTSTGMAVGTLQYMSPEQLCAEPVVDARSDQYALACVLYEMLAGVRPHASASLEGLRMLRLTAQHVPVSVHRPSVPAEIDEALQVALAVAPADRFRDVEALLAALEVVHTGDLAVPGGTGSGARRPGGRSGRGMTPVAGAPAVRETTGRLWGFGLGLVGLAAVALLWRGVSAENRDALALSAPEAGTLTVALAPVAEGADSLAAELQRAVNQELQAWPGVRVQVSSADGGVRIMPSAVRIADRVQLRLDVRADSARVWRVVREAPVSAAQWTPAIADLVREALAGGPASEIPGLDLFTERSLPGLREYARGFAFLREVGALDSASHAFRRARNAVPTFAPAYFWAAQSAAWALPSNSEDWRADADDAMRLGSLRGVDSLLAAGLQHLAAKAYPDACAAYRAAVARDRARFTGWYGLGECLRLDLRVEGTTTQLYFRSSHWEAAQAFLMAARYVETPALLAAVFPRMRPATYSGGAEARQGFGQDRRRQFFAQPSSVGDTLAFVPVAAEIFGDPSTVPATWPQAVRRGRRLGVELTTQWVRRFPASAQGWLEHALSLELAGQLDPYDGRPTHSALAALDRVDALGLPSSMTARLAVARSRLALRQGDTSRAFELARQTLRGVNGTDLATAAILLPLAALAGDSAQVHALYRPDSVRRAMLPAVVADTLDAVERASILGQCDVLRRLHPILERLIASSVAQSELTTVRGTWLPAVYRAAVPCLGAEIFRDLPAVGPTDEAIHALARSDRSRARAILTASRQRLRGATSASVTWDRQTVEAWVLAETGDTTQAVERLTSAVANLASMSLSTLEYPDQAAGLRKGFQLLQDLRRRGESIR
jgi:serine/threonine-protein kinase